MYLSNQSQWTMIISPSSTTNHITACLSLEWTSICRTSGSMQNCTLLSKIVQKYPESYLYILYEFLLYSSIYRLQTHTHNYKHIYIQLTWLVVTEVRSRTFGLVTERRHYSRCTMYCQSQFSSLSVVLRAFSALCMYLTFGHHPHPLGYLFAKFRFFHGLHCWASPWRKIAYSITHSLTQLIWCPRNRSLRFGIAIY